MRTSGGAVLLSKTGEVVGVHTAVRHDSPQPGDIALQEPHTFAAVQTALRGVADTFGDKGALAEFVTVTRLHELLHKMPALVP
jgi:hypothetical protein